MGSDGERGCAEAGSSRLPGPSGASFRNGIQHTEASMPAAPPQRRHISPGCEFAVMDGTRAAAPPTSMQELDARCVCLLPRRGSLHAPRDTSLEPLPAVP
jgi:hypothetical protein